MAHWATSPIDRSQLVLFAPTLNDTVVDSHCVRFFDETLGRLDFAAWEAQYVRVVGQPAIHPKIMASCILYGLSLGIRSSRKLEDAAVNRLDFMWLMQGHRPDHSTLCEFRTQFAAEIKALFKQTGKVAIKCLTGKSRTRRVCRDEHEPLREQMAARMHSPEGKAAYRRRPPIAETPFARLKAHFNLRQFLLRGLDKVKTQMHGAVTAFNLWKLMRLTAAAAA